MNNRNWKIRFRQTKYYLILLFCISLLPSCQKDIPLNNNPSSFAEVFELFWSKMNSNYVYWDIDTTNWDQIHIEYAPIFSKLDIHADSDIQKSLQYFQEITKTLIDAHYSISFHLPANSNFIISPSSLKKQTLTNFHYSYSYINIDIRYLDNNYIIGTDNSNTSYGAPLTTLSGTINNEILFFSCNVFSLLKSYYSQSGKSVSNVLDYFFNQLNDLPNNIKGIIIDVRGNPGGDLGDLNFLVGHFIDEPLHFGYTQTKGGNGRLDFTPWIKSFVNPSTNAKAIHVPIIVLADLNSASLAEAVVMSIKSMPNGIFVGENTWGATGPMTEEEVYNAGQFEISNILSIHTSSCKFKFLEGKIYENIGFPPDHYVPFDASAINMGKDIQLEKAISLIK